MQQYSEDLYNSVKEKAKQLELQYDFLFSAIQTIALDRVKKLEQSEDELQQRIISDYCLVLADIKRQTPGADLRELTDEEYSALSQRPIVADLLAYVSMNDTIKKYHVDASAEALEYTGHLISVKPRIAYFIQEMCRYEITKAYFEIKGMGL